MSFFYSYALTTNSRQEGLKSLAQTPVSLVLDDGMILWLCYDDKLCEYKFFLDQNTFNDSRPVRTLPRGLTKKTVPPVCRSTVEEVYDEAYMCVL